MIINRTLHDENNNVGKLKKHRVVQHKRRQRGSTKHFIDIIKYRLYSLYFEMRLYQN